MKIQTGASAARITPQPPPRASQDRAKPATLERAKAPETERTLNTGNSGSTAKKDDDDHGIPKTDKLPDRLA